MMENSAFENKTHVSKKKLKYIIHETTLITFVLVTHFVFQYKGPKLGKGQMPSPPGSGTAPNSYSYNNSARLGIYSTLLSLNI